MKKRLVAIAILSSLVVGTVIVYLKIYRSIYVLTAEMLKSEEALLQENTVLMASLNVHQLVLLENLWIGSPLESESKLFQLPQDSILDVLTQAAVNPRKDVDYVALAVETGAQELLLTVMVVGRFQPDLILKSLQQKFAVETEMWGSYKIHQYRETDPEICQQKAPRSVYFNDRFLIWSKPEHIKTVISRLYTDKGLHPRLEEWRNFRNNKVFASMLIVPQKVLKTKDIMESIGARATTEKLAPFDTLKLGAGLQPNKAAGEIDFIINYRNPADADLLTKQWQSKLSASKAKWEVDLPNFAQLHKQVQFESRQKEFLAKLLLNKQALAHIRELPRELISWFFSGLGSISTSNVSQSNEDLIKEDAPEFQPQLTVKNLPDFDPKAIFSGKPMPYIAGPFGFEIQRVYLDQKDDQRQIIDFKYVATGLQNIGEAKQLIEVYFKEALDEKGKNQISTTACGPKVVIKPTSPDFFLVYNKIPSHKGNFKLMLNSGVSVNDIRSIKGEAVITLPTAVDTKILPIDVGAKIKTEDFSFILKKADRGYIRYDVYGDAKKLINIEGLNKDDKPLRQSFSSSQDYLFGDGKSNSVEYRGTVKKMQVTYIKEAKTFTVPFEINSGLPQLSEFHKAHERRAAQKPFENFGRDDLMKRFAVRKGKKLIWNPLKPGIDDYLKNRLKYTSPNSNKSAPSFDHRTLNAGPFTLFWEPQEPGSKFKFEIFANEIPNTAHTESLKINFAEILTGDNKVIVPPVDHEKMQHDPWVRPLEMVSGSYRINNQTDQFDFYLTPSRQATFNYVDLPDNLKAEQVKRIKGFIRLRLIPQFKELSLTDLRLGSQLKDGEQTLLTLTEIADSRYEFKTSFNNDSLIGAQLFDENGKELRRQRILKQNGAISIDRYGSESKVVFYFAISEDAVEYPFVMDF